MIILGSHLDIIAAYKEAKRPLDPETISDLLYVAADSNTPPDCQWAVIECKCRICNYTEVIIIPYTDLIDYDNMECENCENCDNLTLQEEEKEDWQIS